MAINKYHQKSVLGPIIPISPVYTSSFLLANRRPYRYYTIASKRNPYLTVFGGSFFTIDTSFTEFCSNPATRNCHYDRLDRTDFVVCNTLFFGDAKVMFHSRIAANSHSCCEVNHER